LRQRASTPLVSLYRADPLRAEPGASPHPRSPPERDRAGSPIGPASSISALRMRPRGSHPIASLSGGWSTTPAWRCY